MQLPSIHEAWKLLPLFKHANQYCNHYRKSHYHKACIAVGKELWLFRSLVLSLPRAKVPSREHSLLGTFIPGTKMNRNFCSILFFAPVNIRPPPPRWRTFAPVLFSGPNNCCKTVLTWSRHNNKSKCRPDVARGSESSLTIFAPWFCSPERKLAGAKVPCVFAPGSESTEEREGPFPFVNTPFKILLMLA